MWCEAKRVSDKLKILENDVGYWRVSHIVKIMWTIPCELFRAHHYTIEDTEPVLQVGYQEHIEGMSWVTAAWFDVDFFLAVPKEMKALWWKASELGKNTQTENYELVSGNEVCPLDPVLSNIQWRPVAAPEIVTMPLNLVSVKGLGLITATAAQLSGPN